MYNYRIFFVFAAIALATTVILTGYIFGLLVAAPMAACVIVCMLGTIDRALVAWLISYAISSTLKRMFFLSPDEHFFGQYIPLGLALACTLVVSARGLKARYRSGMDFMDKSLLVFIMALSGGVVFSKTLSAAGKVIMLAFATAPYGLFYAFRAGCNVPQFFSKFCKAMVVLGLIAGVYGLYQFICGPTWVDQQWAESSGDFSVNARSVLSAMTDRTMMRPYSLFSDHFTYGYFLVAAFVALLAGEWPYKMTQKVFIGLLLLTGLATAMTRTAWAALVMILAIVFVLYRFRLPKMAVPLGVFALYVALSLSLGMAYERWFPAQNLGEGIIDKALTLGTLDERRNAAEAFFTGIQRFALIGDYGAVEGSYWLNAKFSGDLENEMGRSAFDDSHNMFVNLLSQAGVPGLCAFLLFLAGVLSTKTDNFRSALLVASCCALILAGGSGSTTVLGGFLMAWCASVADHGASKSCKLAANSFIRSQKPWAFT